MKAILDEMLAALSRGERVVLSSILSHGRKHLLVDPFFQG